MPIETIHNILILNKSYLYSRTIGGFASLATAEWMKEWSVVVRNTFTQAPAPQITSTHLHFISLRNTLALNALIDSKLL